MSGADHQLIIPAEPRPLDPARSAELARLKTAPRGAPTETYLLDPPIRVMDGPSFAAQYEEIFLAESYDFPYEGQRPTIVDCGANVGAAVIWWSARWPQARVIAFEPDPAVFESLRWNTRYHQNVELTRAALTGGDIGSTFLAEGSDAGRLGDAADPVGRPISVETVRLSSVLEPLESVQLLKLDIEGAETSVLLEAESHLGVVQRIFVEYHSFPERPQVLDELLGVLRRCGFRYYFQSTVRSMRPFRGVYVDRGIDMQCDIFA
ncbi:MAG: FkbM family methyltransferase, partial [Sulfobacillus sp.]